MKMDAGVKTEGDKGKRKEGGKYHFKVARH